uniref:Putative terminase n=1 Tax=viral metagenome TaxID=1070528 RepID=A0A6M3K644_9ZZZZ
MAKPLDSITAGKLVMCETRRQFEKAGFTEPAVAQELALIAFSDLKDYVIVKHGKMKLRPLNNKSHVVKKIKILANKMVELELHDKLQALGMAIDVIGIKKPVKLDVNHSGSIMAAVASHLSQQPEKVENKPKEDKAPVKKVVYRATSKGKEKAKKR